MMTNTMRNTKIRRTLAAIMSSIIIVSAGMTVSATTVNAASMDAVVSSASSASGWKTKLSDSDTALETSIRSVKTYIDILSKKLPCGDYFKVFTSLLDTFDEEFSEKTSLKEVLDKLEEVQKKIEQAKTWLTVGNLKTESFNTNISVVNHYYYDGVRVTNTSLSQETINYAYHSITLCFDTHKQMTEGYVLFFAVA